MKRLERSRMAPVPERTDVNRREFFRLGGAGLLSGALALGGAGSLLLTPSVAHAQSFQLRGLTVHTERLSDTIVNLDRATARYRRPETRDRNGYSNIVFLRHEMTVAVGFAPDGHKTFGIVFPASRDRDPTREGAGTWGMNITDFGTMVSRVTGSELTRVRILVERTTGMRAGREEQILTVTVLPVDSSGRLTSAYQGGYLAVGASYYPDRGVVYGAHALVLEPGAPEPRIAQR